MPPTPGAPVPLLVYAPQRRKRFRVRSISGNDIGSFTTTAVALGLLMAFLLIGSCAVVTLGKVASLFGGANAAPAAAAPHLITDATLGGTQDAFQATYGASPSGTGLTQSYPFSQGHIMATSASDPSSDGKNHIISLRVGPTSGAWDAATATPICAGFLPTDAQFVNEQQVTNLGTERVYTSADLAATFPASAWKSTAPGTLVMELGAGFPSNPGCIITLGA